MKKFALIGLAGYIAPRHLKAIQAVGGELVAALDIADSVGILDAYFPQCEFFTNESDFYDYLLDHVSVDYLVVCSPNHLHEEHCLAGLKLNATVICEKPLGLTTESLRNLAEAENYTEKKIYTILQLRLHPMLQEIKQQLTAGKHQVQITYFTPRGKWYHKSWKGDFEKSGGIATNIGIHLFDLSYWLFGNILSLDVIENSDTESKGRMELEHAQVEWHLSIAAGHTAERRITIDGKSYAFTEGFSDLHTASYEQILQNNGFGIPEVMPSVDMVERIRNAR